MRRSLDWYAVSAENIRDKTIIISIFSRPLYVAQQETVNRYLVHDVSLASSATAITAWNRVRLVNALRDPGLLDFEGSGLPISVTTWPASAERG